MQKEEMTIHKALCEVKLLKKRIEKEINGTKFVISNRANNKKIGGNSIDEFKELVQQQYQSINDLMDRLTAINAAVAQSNAVTKIMNGKYTVAEAISIKNNIIPYKKMLLNSMVNVNSIENTKIEAFNMKLERQADDFVKNGDNDKKLNESLMKLREDYYNNQKLELIDPLDIQKEMTKLSDEIDKFLSEIDSALSVSNAVTTITVEY